MLTQAEKTAIRFAQSRNERSAGDVRQALGIRNDGGDRLRDLLAQLQVTQKQVDVLAAAVKVLQSRP